MTRLYLTGFMCAGKTSAGRALARRLGWQFADTDSLVEQRAGMAVEQIFERHGEAAFRALEAECLRDTAALSRVVVATGGGTPCGPGNMDVIKSSGTSVYLRMPAKQLYSRVVLSVRPRPLLLGMSREELTRYIAATLAQREPFYLQSDHVVDVLEPDLHRRLERLAREAMAAE